MRFASFALLALFAVMVDPTAVPWFVWTVAVIVAVAWWASFGDHITKPTPRTFSSEVRFVPDPERRRPVGFHHRY